MAVQCRDLLTLACNNAMLDFISDRLPHQDARGAIRALTTDRQRLD